MFLPRTVSVAKNSSKKQRSQDAKNISKISIATKIPDDAEFAIKCEGGGEISGQHSERAQKAGFGEGFQNVENVLTSDEEEGEVVEESKKQRWPEPGEPVCVVCGRYGAYICDRTDKDVCSIECKRKHLEKNINERLATYNNMKNSSELQNSPSIEMPVVSSEASGKAIVPVEGSFVNSANLSSYFNENYNYREHPFVKGLSFEQLEFFKKKLEIKTQGHNIPKPGLEFKHFNLPESLEKNLVDNGYLTPTPVQMQAVPIGLCKRDLLACAETGTGKSASFLLPLIARISATTGRCSCQVPLGLILAPTRELCMQIEEQAKLLCKGLKNLKTALLIGGNPLPNQLHRLEQGVQILIATPGRLNDILEKHEDLCDLTTVQILVLDEVDTMLQMGFQMQVDKILEKVPQKSQKMMFSATIPSLIERIASKLLHDPIFVSVGPPSTPNRSVKQIMLWVEERSKKKRLFDLLHDKKYFIPPVLIFVDSKIGADLLADAINKVCRISCASLHGDKSQVARTQVLQDFQNGSYQALVSTSVLGRGIDLINVMMVINFDMPTTVNEYIHQVGRAGRLDTKGFAISFINNDNKNIFHSLAELFEESDTRLPAEVINSPFLQLQKEKRTSKTSKRKNSDVTTGNLMDLLKEYKVKRKK